MTEFQAVEPLAVPPEIMSVGKQHAARWYWEEIFGEHFDAYSDTASRNFVRVCLTLVERVVKNWSNRLYADCTGNVRMGGEVAFEGTAEELMQWLPSCSYTDTLRITKIYLLAQTCEPDDKEEIRKINELMEQQLERLKRAVQFDLSRRLQDAYEGNVDAFIERDRDVNFMGVIRRDAEHVESIVPHQDGHYLLVRSSVIVVDNRARAHPPPMRAAALHFAVLSDKASVVKHLLLKGANARSLPAECGATAFELALANRCKKALAVMDPDNQMLTYSPSSKHSPTSGSPRSNDPYDRRRLR